ncbi:MAG: family 43 glycosylhydrolase [Bacteroidaceae bacterium]|nr:family 43 glycosylhydrolase [Bacteroidaceae bacterium]MBP9637084.1 family 43 glycosylhydrolase [Bacteroidaceae bacterium]
MKRFTFSFLALLLCFFALNAKSPQATKHKLFTPKAVWTDTEGNPINAHGGGLLYHKGTYYWYGEYKVGETTLPSWATWECYRTDVTGISCYSSKDLLNWKYEGLVLKAIPNLPYHDLHPSQVLERPKVIYNKKTKKFVMWAHVESANYGKAAAGVAISDSPTGEFTYLGSFRPNDSMSRDQTVFVDDNGKAYQFASSEENQTLHISELTDDYLKPTGRFVRRFIGLAREAPAVFKYKKKYYMLSSGCTGWNPNTAEIAVADSIMGEWTIIGDPCTGPDSKITFYGQSTYVQPIQGKKNAYIALFDMWKKKDLADSRYIWLPLSFDKDGKPEISWHAEWNCSVFKK